MKSLSPAYYPAGMSRCCSSGQPVLADPMTGRTICSCQMQSGVPAYLSRVPSLPENFYKPGNCELYKSSAAEKSTNSNFLPTNMSTAPPAVHPYYMEHLMAAQSYGMMYPGIDINAIRRKSTNREATGPLKSWLYQHRKNPYPTKAEKVMLAIISQMTLTQVSTWFANARRRLKKEAKMADKDLDLSDIDVDDTGSCDESFSSRLTDSDAENGESKCARFRSSTTELSDVSDAEDLTSRDKNVAKLCVNGLLSPYGRNEICLERNSSPEMANLCSREHLNADTNKNLSSATNSSLTSTVYNMTEQKTKELSDNRNQDSTRNDKHQTNENVSKPKIWSIASMI